MLLFCFLLEQVKLHVCIIVSYCIQELLFGVLLYPSEYKNWFLVFYCILLYTRTAFLCFYCILLYTRTAFSCFYCILLYTRTAFSCFIVSCFIKELDLMVYCILLYTRTAFWCFIVSYFRQEPLFRVFIVFNCIQELVFGVFNVLYTRTGFWCF